jgi:hypothetical protein
LGTYIATTAVTMKRKFSFAIGIIVLVLSVALFTSCTGTKKTADLAISEEQTAYTPQIIFLNYSLERDSLEVYNIELINKIVASGTVKPTIHHNSTGKPGDFRCLILDANRQPISDIIVPDPLTKRIEYQQENGSLSSRQIQLDRAEFSVRMQLDSASRFIAIERINPSGTSQLIITELD